MQLFTYETMSENIDLTGRKGLWDVFTVKRRTSTQLLTYNDVSVSNFYKEGVSICNSLRNFVCLISTDMFPRKFVDYETSSCAYSHTKRCVSAHFLTYEDMSMRYI